ncbi:hypothetical protein [Bacillus horti]|nr:hypothetical protein [Bacillus horti]
MTFQHVHSYINQVCNLYVHHFDIYRNQKMEGFDLDFMAAHKRRDEKYMISKNIKVWGVENQQYIFTATSKQSISKEFIAQFKSSLNQVMPDFIPYKKEHMSTIFIGVVITNQTVSKTIEKEAVKYRKLKFLNFGWYGWAECYLAIVSLKENKIAIHPKGQPFVKPFIQILNEGVA